MKTPITVIMSAVAFIAIALTISACDQKGLKVGVLLQDCPGIAANQRQEAGTLIKGLSRELAIKALAQKYGLTDAEAASCLK